MNIQVRKKWTQPYVNNMSSIDLCHQPNLIKKLYKHLDSKLLIYSLIFHHFGYLTPGGNSNKFMMLTVFAKCILPMHCLYDAPRTSSSF